MRGGPLVLVGTGETALLALEYFTHDSPYDVVAFSCDRSHMPGDHLEGLPVVALEELAERYPPDAVEVFVAIGATDLNRLRRRLFEQVKGLGYRCASYVSSRAFVWRNVALGENCFVFEGNVLQPFVTIGDDVVLWSGNHVGHRSVIEDHCFVTSHVVISASCRIGAGSFLGVNATFNDRTSLARDCVLGSASLVVKPLSEPESVYVGQPARRLEGRSAFDVPFS
jgi:sugar O-acyltransferase (sialic acid O-acetyltransferase NeuD family)